MRKRKQFFCCPADKTSEKTSDAAKKTTVAKVDTSKKSSTQAPDKEFGKNPEAKTISATTEKKNNNGVGVAIMVTGLFAMGRIVVWKNKERWTNQKHCGSNRGPLC